MTGPGSACIYSPSLFLTHYSWTLAQHPKLTKAHSERAKESYNLAYLFTAVVKRLPKHACKSTFQRPAGFLFCQFCYFQRSANYETQEPRLVHLICKQSLASLAQVWIFLPHLRQFWCFGITRDLPVRRRRDAKNPQKSTPNSILFNYLMRIW